MGGRNRFDDILVGIVLCTLALAIGITALGAQLLPVAAAGAACVGAFWHVHASGERRLAARQASMSAERDAATSDDVATPESAPEAMVEPSAEPEATPERAISPTESEAEGKLPQAGDATEDDDLQAAEPEASKLNVAALVDSLMRTASPLEELEEEVRAIQARSESGARPSPSETELFFARSLEEAGLLDDDIELPDAFLASDGRTGLVRFSVISPTTTYLAMQRLLAIEGALRRIICAELAFGDLSSVTQDELQAFTQGLFGSVMTQVSGLSVGDVTRGEERPDGEWAVRRGLALVIDSLQTPARLDADFRVNMESGSIAIQVKVPSADVMPKTAWSAELGRTIDTTTSMRVQAASAYALRLGLTLAYVAAWCSPQVREVYVAGVRDTAARHLCLYSARFTRAQLEQIDPADVGDPYAIFRRVGATMDEHEGVLAGVRQTFSLEDERFCPPSRYDEVELSGRVLPDELSRVLGAQTVSDLGINGDASRMRMADDIMRSIVPTSGSSAERNVGIILDTATRANDPMLLHDAHRTVSKIISGQLDEGNAVAIGDEFAHGDELSQAVNATVRAMMAGRPLGDSIRALELALLPIDGVGAYDDGPDEEWRTFGSYVDRALYNRTFAQEGVRVRLVPPSYYHAHLMLSNALLLEGRAAEALPYARRALELCPLDDRAHLRLVRCHELVGEIGEAIACLRSLIEVAHDSEAIGVAYYRMAFMQWRKERPRTAAACYIKSLQFPSTMFPLALMELGKLKESFPEADFDLNDGDIEVEFAARNIPLAPTRQVEDVLVEGAKAALDANIFPAARDFAFSLGALTGDELVRNIFHSLEREPDR